eukprot:SAG11_NODE_21_length_25065_cov_3.589081_27_plen_176_part_00
MTLLTLELLGDSTAVAETTHTLDFPLSFTTATLRAVDLHAPGSQLTQTWTTTHSGDGQGSSRDVYSPLYVDLDGLCDDGAVRFYSSDDDDIPLRTLIPTGTYMSGVRKLDVPLAKGDFELPAGSKITVRMFYRSVENGTYGDIVPMPASASDGEGGTTPGVWSNDCWCTLYIDLQ